MSFNSAAYYRNKWRREALDCLAEARRLKAELDAERSAELPSFTFARYGESHWLERIASAAKRARINWRLYRSQCRVAELSRPSWRKPLPFKPAPFGKAAGNA